MKDSGSISLKEYKPSQKKSGTTAHLLLYKRERKRQRARERERERERADRQKRQTVRKRIFPFKGLNPI